MKFGEVVGGQKVGKTQSNQQKTYSELFAEYMRQLQIKGRAEQTLKSYSYHSKYFIEFLGSDVYCKDITSKTLEDYILYLQDAKHIE